MDPEFEQYLFYPKPPRDPVVIPTIKLLHFFNKPECAGTSSDFLTRIPKRIGGELPQNADVAWGVQLQLDHCGYRVSVLLLFFWLCAVTFAGWWISGHPTDIQNATVPLTSVLAVVAILVAIRQPNSLRFQNIPQQPPATNSISGL
jgi:hypothetical protein